jgi:formylglycine-generating enzyme required for sulfatase activity
MVTIPAGTNTGTDPDFGAYSLTLPSPLYMDKYEVTKAKWDEVYSWAITHGYSFTNAGNGKAMSHPVHTVNWYDCVKWCNARSQMEGRIPAYYTSSSKSTVYKTGQIDIDANCVNWSSGFRLPTSVEWEYAARGGVASKRFPWGDTIDHVRANYLGSSGLFYDLGYAGNDTRYSTGGYPYTSPVGAFELGKNGFGLYDMAGNVWEWCWDGNPGSPSSSRVLRGGSWFYFAGICRVGNCGQGTSGFANYFIGFRAALFPNQ